jgi:hypothetical protein
MSEPITHWISFQLAAEEVERTLGVSWGMAQKTVLDACASGKLPSKPSDCSGGREIGKDSFRAWLSALSTSKPKKRAYEQERVQEAFRDLYRDGKLPVSNTVLENDVRVWFERRKKRAPERTTILRAAGRRTK